MNEHYLASRVRLLSEPIIAYRDLVLRDLLPAFGDIDERARKMRTEHFNWAIRQPAGEYEIDMADIAETAQQLSYDWWNTMTCLRQSMLNLWAAGLFHLAGQQRAVLSRDGIFRGATCDTKIAAVKTWYQEKLYINFEALPSWPQINQMRLVANTVKHGEGGSADELRSIRPELCFEPFPAEYYEHLGIDTNARIAGAGSAAPLAGDDFFVTEKILREYAEATLQFFSEVAAALER